MPKTKKRTPRQKINEIAKMRAQAHIVFAELTDLKIEVGIIRKAVDSEGGVEWYLHNIMSKISDLDKQHKELKKKIGESVKYD